MLPPWRGPRTRGELTYLGQSSHTLLTDNSHMEDKIRNWPTKLLHCALELIESGETLLLGRFGTAEEMPPSRFTEEVRQEIQRRQCDSVGEPK